MPPCSRHSHHRFPRWHRQWTADRTWTFPPCRGTRTAASQPPVCRTGDMQHRRRYPVSNGASQRWYHNFYNDIHTLACCASSISSIFIFYTPHFRSYHSRCFGIRQSHYRRTVGPDQAQVKGEEEGPQDDPPSFEQDDPNTDMTRSASFFPHCGHSVSSPSFGEQMISNSFPQYLHLYSYIGI